MKLTNRTTPQARNYQCDICKEEIKGAHPVTANDEHYHNECAMKGIFCKKFISEAKKELLNELEKEIRLEMTQWTASKWNDKYVGMLNCIKIMEKKREEVK